MAPPFREDRPPSATAAERRAHARQRLSSIRNQHRTSCRFQWAAILIAFASMSSLALPPPATTSVLICVASFVATLGLAGFASGKSRRICVVALLIVVVSMVFSLKTLAAQVIAGFKDFRY